MEVIVEQGPGVAAGSGIFKQYIQPLNKIFPVSILQKNLRALNPSGDDVLQPIGIIYAGMTWHDGYSDRICGNVNNVP